MRRGQRIATLFCLLALFCGCANVSSKQQVLAAGSQVEVRSYQTRSYDTTDKTRVMRAVMSTLQDLRFVIDKADDTVGIVSATKLDGYALTMSVSVRPSGEQMVVRANAQFNLKAIEEPGPYQDFFSALDKGLFLDDNLLHDDTATRAPVSPRSAPRADPVGPDVYAFYGEAEAEIDTGSYDRDLWARALVLVDGDENRRKARYIELRAEQLHARQPAVEPILPIESTAVAPAPQQARRREESKVAGADLTGVYESEITSNSNGIFGTRYRRLTLTIEQSGNRISARDDRYGTRLVGEIDGDTVRFEVENGRASGHYPAKGEWRIVDGGSLLTGTWRTHGGWVDAQGEWNLVRLN